MLFLNNCDSLKNSTHMANEFVCFVMDDHDPRVYDDNKTLILKGYQEGSHHHHVVNLIDHRPRFYLSTKKRLLTLIKTSELFKVPRAYRIGRIHRVVWFSFSN